MQPAHNDYSTVSMRCAAEAQRNRDSQSDTISLAVIAVSSVNRSSVMQPAHMHVDNDHVLHHHS